MSEVNLSKGESLNLEKNAFTGNPPYYIGLGWKEKPKENESDPDFDVDVYAVALDASGKYNGDKATIAFWPEANRSIMGGALTVSKDNQSGGSGDCEFTKVKLDDLADTCGGVVVGLNIYDGNARNQKFGDIEDLFVRLVIGDGPDGEQVAGFKLDIAQIAPDATAILYVKFVPVGGGEWKYEAVGQALDDRDAGSDIPRAVKALLG